MDTVESFAKDTLLPDNCETLFRNSLSRFETKAEFAVLSGISIRIISDGSLNFG
jgi:hypothetical protein